MQVRGASLLITFRCPSKCDHCAYNAGPEQVGHISLDDAEQWLSDLAENKQFEWLTLHGGEPFLYLDDMKAMLTIAKDLGVPRRGSITNGFWARTSHVARKTLKELIDAGLNTLTFSVDGFHQQYIDIRNVKLGIEAAVFLGLEKVWVDSYYMKSLESKNPYDQLTKASLREVQDIEGIEQSLYPVDFEGRGAKSLIGYAEMSPEIPHGKCILPFWLGGDLRSPEVIEIDFEGNITLCPGICIGNAKRNSLSDSLNSYSYSNHPIIRILAETGPIGLYQLALQHGLEPNSTFVNECHLCFEMRRLLHYHYPKLLAPIRCYQ
ncbi:MAG: hypothetical protein AM326_07740 [Candidatus Thorarchaeota archaeon SMTZ-45]|nr:MAG: hypothetical protein AM325_02420 [Candidatus Thorarchaeota archaeon SMTZ1-45]KXH76111.1 MAG: hypothetical protein AM326_07740 [Candidatus Thorarchaeota archaeon SMTZ-45]